jgi:hypothetical protein
MRTFDRLRASATYQKEADGKKTARGERNGLPVRRGHLHLQKRIRTSLLHGQQPTMISLWRQMVGLLFRLHFPPKDTQFVKTRNPRLATSAGGGKVRCKFSDREILLSRGEQGIDPSLDRFSARAGSRQVGPFALPLDTPAPAS